MNKILFFLSFSIVITLFSSMFFVSAQSSDSTLCRVSNPVDVPYSAMGAKVKEICHDADANSLIIYAEATDDAGTINLEIPRILLDQKHQDCSDLPIFVLLDGEETSSEEVKTNKFRILTIPIHENLTEIEIATSITPIMDVVPFMQCNKGLIPEFPPLQQAKYGIPANELACKEGLELVFKFNDKSPACVKKETALKISGRGWGSPHWNEEVMHLAQQESTLTRTLIVKAHDKYSFDLGQPSATITERILHPKPIEKFEVWRLSEEVMKITDVEGNDIIDKEDGNPNYPRGGSRVMPAECAEGIKHARFATPLIVNVKPDVTSDILIEYPAYIVRLDDQGNYQMDFESLYETEMDFVSDVIVLSFQTEKCKINHHVYSNVIFYQVTFKFTN